MAEGEWCAQTDPAAKSTVNAIKIPEILYLKEILPFTLGEYTTQAVRFQPAPCEYWEVMSLEHIWVQGSR